MTETRRVLVTGGGGFLGSAICLSLCRQGWRVRSFSRGIYPGLERLGVACFQGDLRDPDQVREAVSGCTAVIHTGAVAGIWGPADHFMGVNFQGTLNVLRACRQLGVRRLVYTSSPSVVSRNRDIEGADESLDYPEAFTSWYALSKKKAEEAVLAAHRGQEFCSLALRPHLIWGPGDPHFLPRLRDRAARKRLIRLGRGDNLVDVIYVENAARAHVSALEAMGGADFSGGGRAYFLGQERPVRLWGFLDQLLQASGHHPLPRFPSLPFPAAWLLGGLSELVWSSFGVYDKEPPLTRFTAVQLCRSHYFNHKEAQKHLGYKPEISIEEGLRLLQRGCSSQSGVFGLPQQ